MQLLSDSDYTTQCGWKGMANYYSASVNGETNANCAWIYRNPKAAAADVENRIAFWNGVIVSKAKK